MVIICLFSFFSHYEITQYTEQKSKISALAEVELVGIIYDLPKQTERAYAFTIQTVVEGETLLFRILATQDFITPTIEKISQLPIGKQLKITGELSRNTGMQNFYGFDAEQYERQSNRMGSIFLSEVPIVQKEQKYSIRSIILNLRAKLMETVNQNGEFLTANAYTHALVFGERSGMDDEISDLYQKYGLVHLLAISGMQIHLFTFGLFAFLLRLGFTKERLYIFLLLFQPVLFILTGGSTSVGRACMTTAVFLLFQLFFVRKDVSFPICLAFFITVVFNPDVCLDIGFQLSFFLSACLLFSRNILARMRNFVSQMFMASLICQIASLPILLFHFHTYAPLSLFLNLLFIPFINFFVFPLGLLIVAWSLLHLPFRSLLFTVLEKGLIWSEAFLLFLSEFVKGTLIFAHPSIILFLTELVVVVLLLTRVEQKGFRKCQWVLGLFICLFVFHYFSPKFNAEAQVSFLDVGQGDCTVIITPFQKEVILIDSGGVLPFRGEGKNQQIAEGVILPYLQANGVHKLTHYVATHGDIDHIGTLPYLQEMLEIENLLLGKKASYDDKEQTAIKRQQESHQNVRFLEMDDVWTIQSGTIFCFNPTTTGSQEGNASSVVLCMKLYDQIFYFMGDAEKDEERNIASAYELPKADFLKVGHHGSKTSSEKIFIEEIQPTHSVLSLGKNNTYGHPHQETVETLTQYSEKILRTDEQGQIICLFDKNSLTLSYRVHMLTE